MWRKSICFPVSMVILLGVLLLAACSSPSQELPELPAGFARYLDEEVGLTFAYPQGWFVADMPRVRVIASSEALLETPEITAANLGSLAQVAIGNTEQLGGNDNPVEIVNLHLDSSGARGQVDILEGPDSISINGHPAATVTLASESNGLPLILRLVVIRHGERVLTISTATPASIIEETGPLLDSFIDSFKILTDEPLPETS